MSHRQVPTIQTQRTVEIPQAQYIDKNMDVPVVYQRQKLVRRPVSKSHQLQFKQRILSTVSYVARADVSSVCLATAARGRVQLDQCSQTPLVQRVQMMTKAPQIQFSDVCTQGRGPTHQGGVAAASQQSGDEHQKSRVINEMVKPL